MLPTKTLRNPHELGSIVTFILQGQLLFANNSTAEVLADIALLFYGFSLCGFDSVLSNVEKFDVEES